MRQAIGACRRLSSAVSRAIASAVIVAVGLSGCDWFRSGAPVIDPNVIISSVDGVTPTLYSCEPIASDLATPPPEVPVLSAPDGSTPSVTIPDDSGLPALCPAGEVPKPIAFQAPKGWPSWNFNALAPDRLGPLQTPPGVVASARDGKIRGLPRPLLASSVYRHATMFHISSPVYGAGYIVQAALPKVDDNGHSLNEIAMRKSMSGKLTAVEIGWRVAPSAWPKGYGDGADPKPHLFVFAWINGYPLCYDGCGWEQVSTNVVPGYTSLSPGDQAYTGWLYYEGNWWAWWNRQWLGYYPGVIFSIAGGFPNARVQWFGEVIEEIGSPTWNEMGTGKPFWDAAASDMGFPCLISSESPPWKCAVKAVSVFDKGTDYPYTLESSPPAVPDTHRYGGPSW